jgi:hypothetical protein
MDSLISTASPARGEEGLQHWTFRDDIFGVFQLLEVLLLAKEHHPVHPCDHLRYGQETAFVRLGARTYTIPCSHCFTSVMHELGSN